MQETCRGASQGIGCMCCITYGEFVMSSGASIVEAQAPNRLIYEFFCRLDYGNLNYRNLDYGNRLVLACAASE